MTASDTFPTTPGSSGIEVGRQARIVGGAHPRRPTRPTENAAAGLEPTAVQVTGPRYAEMSFTSAGRE